MTGRGQWRMGQGGMAALLLLGGLALPLAAQEAPAVPDPATPSEPSPVPPEERQVTMLPSPLVTLDQDRFFKDSLYGKAALARAEADASALSAENRKLEAALEAEEKDLTERRAALKPEAFAPLAAAFDAKVEAIRTAQEAKSRSITRRLEDERHAFFEAAVPVLGDLLRDTGAVAILADNAIILSLSAVDMTDEAVARIDKVLTDLPPDPPGDVPSAPAEPDAPGPAVPDAPQDGTAPGPLLPAPEAPAPKP